MAEDPDWYAEWSHAAVHELREKNALLEARFRIGDWPRYDYDLDAGTLTFSDSGGPKVVAGVQIAGSTSARSGDWLWAWAHAHWSAELITDAEIVRAFGEQHGIWELSQASVEADDLSGLGWALTAVTARLTDSIGAYRPPRDEGGVYLIYKTMGWAS